MDSKVKILLIAIILSVLVLGCTTPSEKTVQNGNHVSVDYTLRDVNGKVLETSNATVARDNGIYNPSNPYANYSFVVGSNGVAIKGFDDAVRGMKINQTKTNITITPNDAYGDYNVSKVIITPLETVYSNTTNFSLYLNDTINYNDDYIYVAALGSNNSSAKIVPLSKISSLQPYTININANDTATLDYNHPLAGKTLVFDITVLDIK
jgi:peptidylprolyl isomerase